MTAHRPRKRFGQHFLHDQTVVGRIIDAFQPNDNDTIVEIGPGYGALTTALLASGATVHAVELDRDLCRQLKEQYKDNNRFVLHQADALGFEYCSLTSGNNGLRLIGNLPYNISTPLLFLLLDQTQCIQEMCFMLQREVVDRMRAKPGGKDYGRLSVMVQYQCAVEKLFDVAAGAFQPAPKVKSAVVRLRPHAELPVKVGSRQVLSAVVRHAFAQRRKTLGNGLKPLLTAEAIAALDIDPGRRAETLTLAEFARLADAVQQRQHS